MDKGRGVVAALLETAYSRQINNPEAMKRRQQRLHLANITKEVDSATRKLTSGTAFHNGEITLHSDHV
jgi:hypothetical protein